MSYGLYVFHALALKTAEQAIQLRLPEGVIPEAVRIIFTAGLTVAIAVVSYRWLETPFLRLKGKFSYVRSVTVATEMEAVSARQEALAG
jgi:peptidoglycan/LPS O-acetylase OafA/YrhL